MFAHRFRVSRMSWLGWKLKGFVLPTVITVLDMAILIVLCFQEAQTQQQIINVLSIRILVILPH